MNYLKPIVIVTISLVMSGCINMEPNAQFSTQSIALANRSLEVDQLWNAANETLRRHRFQLDRVDRRSGVITTIPLTSQSIVEFWRHDVDTWQDLWESTLNPLRRKVTINFGRDENGNWTSIAVAVNKQRLSSPDRQFNSTGAAYRYFGTSLPSTTGKVDLSDKDDRWIDEGSDPAMEDYLLRKIFDRAEMDFDTANPVSIKKSLQPVEP